jgi:hypothetical protein
MTNVLCAQVTDFFVEATVAGVVGTVDVDFFC